MLNNFKEKVKETSKIIKEKVIDPIFVTQNYQKKVFDEVNDLLNSQASREIRLKIFPKKIRKDELKSSFGREVYDKYFSKENDELDLKLTPIKKKKKDGLIVKQKNKISDVKELENIILYDIDTNISLKTLLDYYKQKGIVGEKPLCILQTFGAINKLCFGVEGPSGSGKSFVVDKLIELLPEGYVYKMELSSKTAEIYNSDIINKHEIIYIPELQKAMKSNNQIIVEILKNLTEGKDANRIVRNQANNKNINYRIEKGKGIIYTLALENDYKKDVELSRRVFQLYTDISKEHTNKVLKYKAQSRFKKELNEIDEKELASLRKHIKDCIDIKIENYINPFALYLESFIPRENKAKSFIDYYFNLMEASAKFHYKNRLINSNTIFLNLEDAYLVHTLYGKQFLLSVLKIPMLGEKTLDVFNSDSLSSRQVYDILKRDETGLTLELIDSTLEDLVSTGYLVKSNEGYNNKDKIEKFQDSINWAGCFENALNIMKEHYPEIAVEWVKNNIKDNRISVYNPIKDNKIVLANLENDNIERDE